MKYIIPIILFTLTSCIQIGDKPQPQNYYLLEPGIIINKGESHLHSTLNINIEPIDLALFLDKPYIAFHDHKNLINYQQTERWAEPLGNNIGRVIRNNLTRALGAAVITLGPWEKISSESLDIKVVIDDFSSHTDNTTSISAVYQITWAGKTHIGEYHKKLPAEVGVVNQVKALNINLDQFCMELVENIRKVIR